MKRAFGILAVFGLAVTVATQSWAIDAKQFGCEKATVVELAKVSRFRGKCIRKCLLKKQAKPGSYTCSPVFDSSTQSCADKAVNTYGIQITSKCTGYLPPCGGYEKGWCSNDTSQICNRDVFDCPGTCSAGFCAHDGVTPCTANGDCDGRCGSRCSVTTSQPCSTAADCPGGESCGRAAGTPKDIAQFIAGNLYDGDPLGPLDQVDLFGEKLIGCRQSVCSTSGELCAASTDCGLGETCTPGKCSDGSLCSVDGECGAATTKKCIALGRCSATAQSCRTGVTGDCPLGETCERWGRCTGGSNNQENCFFAADCPDAGGACTRTTVDTDRKQELKCTSGISDAMGKYTFDVANCQAKCAQERDQKDGQRCTGDTSQKCATDDDCTGIGVCRPTSCDPFAVGRCSNNPFQVCTNSGDCPSPGTCTDTTPDPISASLKACRDLAKSKALTFINAKCPSLPVCGAYSVYGNPISNFNRPEDLIGFITGQQDGQFKEDNPDLSPGSNFCLP